MRSALSQPACVRGWASSCVAVGARGMRCLFLSLVVLGLVAAASGCTVLCCCEWDKVTGIERLF